jgi:hypothetical protein
VKDIHCVNNHGAVGGIFPDGVSKLLDGLEGVEIENFLPGIHAIGGPVPVNAADGDLSMPAGFHQHLGEKSCLGIVAVDQHGDFVARKGFDLFVCHTMIIHSSFFNLTVLFDFHCSYFVKNEYDKIRNLLQEIHIISTSRKRVIGGLYRLICATPALAGGARGERTLRSTRGFRDLLTIGYFHDSNN